MKSLIRHKVVTSEFIGASEFIEFVGSEIVRAKSSVFISTFLADLRPNTDVDGHLRAVCHLLGAAVAQGLDIRVLVSSVTLAPDQRRANYPFVRFLVARNVPVRIFMGDRAQRSLHAKAIIIDSETCIVGSQNLTPAANIEANVCTKSTSGAIELESWFRQAWKNGQLP